MIDQTSDDIMRNISPARQPLPVGVRLLVLFGGLLIALVAYLAFMQVQKPVEVVSPTSQEQTTTASSNFVFSLKTVPDALDIITLTATRDTTLDQNKLVEYQTTYAARDTTSEFLRNDSPYNLQADNLGILTVIETDEQRDLLLQIHDELLALSQYYNEQLKQPSPRQQGVGIELPLPYEAAPATVSPSAHVILTLYFADILKTVAGPKVSDEVDQQVRGLINNGVVYGLYTYSDIATSEDLYRQYTTQLLDRYPELATVISGLK